MPSFEKDAFHAQVPKSLKGWGEWNSTSDSVSCV